MSAIGPCVCCQLCSSDYGGNMQVFGDLILCSCCGACYKNFPRTVEFPIEIFTILDLDIAANTAVEFKSNFRTNLGRECDCCELCMNPGNLGHVSNFPAFEEEVNQMCPCCSRCNRFPFAFGRPG